MRVVLGRMAWFAFALSIVVVMLGAYTRLSDAGLGCPDWPGCYGHWDVPQAHHEVQAANEAFPHRPVEAEKAWLEMIHRYAAGMLGLLVLLITFLGLRSNISDKPTKHMLFLLALIAFQAVLGMWTVTWNLLPLIVTMHLIGGISTLVLLFLLAMRFKRRDFLGNRLRGPATSSLTFLAWLSLLVVAFQILLGGWTSTNYAALACPDLPFCQGVLIPEMDFSKGFDITSPVGPNYEGGLLDAPARTAIHWSHRMFALVVILVVGLLGLKARSILDPVVSGLGRFILAALSIQVVLGLSNVYFALPLGVAVLHNAGAAMLLVSVVALLFKLTRKQQGGT